MSYTNRKWTDGDYLHAKAVSLPEFQAPIPGSTAEVLFTQKWQIARDQFSALALNTSHAVETSFFLVAETEPKADLGGGVVEWTRTYAKKPDTYSDWETFAYPFIGYYGSWGPNEVIPTGRSRQTFPVVSRVEHAFYLIGTNGTGLATVDYATPGDIPVYQAQKYRLTPSGMTWWMDVDFLGDNPPFNPQTYPDRSTYEEYCSNAATYRWSAGSVQYIWSLSGGSPAVTVSGLYGGANPGQIIAEDSRLDRWHGNIWLRRTRYILAQ